jgi:hypothetical protein
MLCMRIAMLGAGLMVAAPGWTQTVTGEITGFGPDGGRLSAQVAIEFTAGPGDPGVGRGTGACRVTLRNRSSVVSSRAGGNPLATALYLNAPDGATVRLRGVTLAAGSIVAQTGVSHDPVPGQVLRLAAPMDVTQHFLLLRQPEGLRFGRFDFALVTRRGSLGGLLNPAVFEGLDRRGCVYSVLTFAGDLVFDLEVAGLGSALDVPGAMLGHCSEGAASSRSAAQFQGLGVGGYASEFVADPCGATSVEASSWGKLKALYR